MSAEPKSSGIGRSAPRSGRRIILWAARATPHLYLAILGVAGGIVVAVLDLWAYYDEGLTATKVAFAATAVTTAILFFTFFWGCFLVMAGTIPMRRLRYIIFHGALGCLSPLIYTLSISSELPKLGNQPIGDLEVYLGLVSLIVLVVQFLSGWSVLDRRPWRLLTFSGTR